MTSTRAFLVGIGAVAGLALAVHASSPWWMAVPIVALLAIALFAGGATGWWTRAGRGIVAALIASAAAIATVFVLRELADWYDFPADSAGALFIALLALHAAIPAALVAIAHTRLRAAFVAGFDVALLAATSRTSQPIAGVLVLVVLGTVIGAAVAPDANGQ